MLFRQLSSSHSINMVGHKALGGWQSHPMPLPSLNSGKGSSLPSFVPLNGTGNSESVVGVTSGLVISMW